MAAASALPNLHPMILRLDRNNYSFWKLQVLTTVRAHGFDDLISSTVAPPLPYLPAVAGAPPAENPAYLQWIRKDQFLMSWILSSIGESMLGHVVRCSSSSEIWKTLEQLFQSQSRARILQLKRQLHNQKKGSLSVDEFFLKMRGYADQLSATGHVVRDEDLGDFILSGFGPEYEAVVINLLHRSEPPNLQEMQFALQSHEIRLQQSYSMLSDSSAHFVQRGGGRGSRGRGGSSGRSGQFRPSFGKSSSIVCQICQRSGHVALKCYKRFDVHFTQNDNSNPQAYVADVQTELDYDEEEGVWYVDSGATNHVTNSLHNLQIQAPYTGSEALTVGNGKTIPISSIGFNSFPSFSNTSLLLNHILYVPQITKNLMSISQFTKDNCVFFEFHDDCCLVKDKITNHLLLKGKLHKGLYQLDLSKLGARYSHTSSNQSPSTHGDSCFHVFSDVDVKTRSACNSFLSNIPSCNIAVQTSSDSIKTWHQKLGHPHISVLSHVLKSLNISPQTSLL